DPGVPTLKAGQKGSLPKLFNHLVGTGEQRKRNGEAEGLGRLEVDDQFELDRRLNRQLARLLSAKNAIDIGRGASKQVDDIDCIYDQGSAARKLPIRVGGWQGVTRRETSDQIGVGREKLVRRCDQAAIWFLTEVLDRAC